MLHIKVYDENHKPTQAQKSEVVDFLFEHLENYGDAKQHIAKAIDYATGEMESFGGFTMLLYDEKTLKGAVVINRTGMGGYIPENILVYIAISKQHRGEGLGKALMQKVIERCEGDIALHVEANNPARKLYEKFGFTNPYLEMRLKK